MVFTKRVLTIKANTIYKQLIGTTGDHSDIHMHSKRFFWFFRYVFGYMFVVDEPTNIEAGTQFKSCKSYRFNTYENVWVVIINPHPHDITIIVENKVSVFTVAYYKLLGFMFG